jgi:tRNA G37 N-methylase Trm5
MAPGGDVGPTIGKTVLYMCLYKENILKIFFSRTTGSEKLKLNETLYKSKFVQIMAPGLGGVTIKEIV